LLPGGSRGYGKAKPDRLQYCRQGFKRRVPLGRQRAIQAFTLDAGGLGNVGHAVGFGDVAQGDKEHGRLLGIFHGRLEVLRRIDRIGAKFAHQGFVVADAGTVEIFQGFTLLLKSAR